MCVTGTSAVRKKPNVTPRYVEVTINMSLDVYHLEQQILILTGDWDRPAGTVFQADP